MKFTICMLCVGCGLEKLEGDHRATFSEVLDHCAEGFSFRLGREELPASPHAMRSAAMMEAKPLDADNLMKQRRRKNRLFPFRRRLRCLILENGKRHSL